MTGQELFDAITSFYGRNAQLNEALRELNSFVTQACAIFRLATQDQAPTIEVVLFESGGIKVVVISEPPHSGTQAEVKP